MQHYIMNTWQWVQDALQQADVEQQVPVSCQQDIRLLATPGPAAQGDLLNPQICTD